MRPGGIQDASSANELYSPVDTDPEDPVIGEKQLPMPAKRCLRRSDREKLRRVSVNQTKVLKKLDHAVELLSADPPVCTSAGFFSMLCDSIILIREDRAVIWQFLGRMRTTAHQSNFVYVLNVIWPMPSQSLPSLTYFELIFQICRECWIGSSPYVRMTTCGLSLHYVRWRDTPSVSTHDRPEA